MDKKVNSIKKFIEWLEGNNIYQEIIIPNIDMQGPLSAFRIDERKSKKWDGKKMSIRQFAGMDQWPSCDYLFIKDTEGYEPVLFIIEKTDLVASAGEIKKASSKYKEIRPIVRDGISKKCGCDYKTQKIIIADIVEELSNKNIIEELTAKNKRKIFSSLHILSRLQNHKEIKNFSLEDFECCFIIWNVPNPGNKDLYNYNYNIVAIHKELAGDLMGIPENEREQDNNLVITGIKKRITYAGHSLSKDIDSKSHSKINPTKAVKISFGGIVHGKSHLNPEIEDIVEERFAK